jgi:capsular exopolysaccharide synthesis family protein
VASAIRTSNVRVLDAAEPPSSPFKPRVIWNVLGGVLVGSFLGMAAISLRESRDNRLRHPGDSKRFLALPELGVIPSTPRPRLAIGGPLGRIGDGNGTWNGPGVGLAALSSEHSYFSESVRNVLASILLNENGAHPPKVLVISSPSPGEGKTTVASSLGIALARFGRRVLLVDADARRPQLHRLFQVSPTPGLGDALTANGRQEEILRAAIKETAAPGLSVLPCGEHGGHFADLLFSGRMGDLLNRLRREYDAVLIDTPPVLLLSDARPLGRVSDGVILVVRSGETEKENAILAHQIFAEDGTPVFGTVLNDWRPGDQKAYRRLAKYYASTAKTDRHS